MYRSRVMRDFLILIGLHDVYALLFFDCSCRAIPFPNTATFVPSLAGSVPARRRADTAPCLEWQHAVDGCLTNAPDARIRNGRPYGAADHLQIFSSQNRKTAKPRPVSFVATCAACAARRVHGLQRYGRAPPWCSIRPPWLPLERSAQTQNLVSQTLHRGRRLLPSR